MEPGNGDRELREHYQYTRQQHFANWRAMPDAEQETFINEVVAGKFAEELFDIEGAENEVDETDANLDDRGCPLQGGGNL